MTRTRWKVRLGSLLVAGALVATTTACYGPFGLTRKIYDWNGRATGNRIANSAIMWGLILIPVYELSLVVDFLVLNPIDFLTGEEPVAHLDDGGVEHRRAGRAWRVRPLDGRTVEVRRDGRLVGHIVVDTAGAVAYDAAGRRLARIAEGARTAAVARRAEVAAGEAPVAVTHR